ncbi:unnamed protein product [Mortierella alpina]
MASRPSVHLSIDTHAASAANAARRTLPSPMSSSSSLPPCPPDEEVITTATLSHPPTLAIPSVPYPPNNHHSQQNRQRYQTLSGGRGSQSAPVTPQWQEADGGQGVHGNMIRRPSLPVNQHQYPHQQPQHNHPNSHGQQGQHHAAHQPSYNHQQPPLPLTPSTPPPSAPAVRHPLWRLECSSCKTTLCEQAMQGHLVGDPSKKLFSTNLALGVLGLPDRPVSIICPCKFHLFACASCGSVCGYNLSQPCAGCETNRGNGHFWIFYAHEIIPHWRTIGDRNMFWDDLPTWRNKPDGNVGR